MKKDKIIWLSKNRCKHSHTYLEHYNCYLSEHPEENRIGYFDIESSSLVADFGFCICWKILSKDGEMFGRVIKKEEVLQREAPDKNLMKELVDTFGQFDLLYTYNGTRFDFPFVRTRSVICNVDFPTFGAVKHKDIYYPIKNKFRLHRKSLEVACEMLLGNTTKTRWMGKHWIGAVQGVSKSLDYIEEHCENDVRDLKALTDLVIDFVNPNTTRSI
ncbi:MAG: ribonuclease H-like domain-containing protein [Patescibacteria group bacterium]|nr:ribonuclease H-like domain-containing protein [Patescibacteria group bacterium]